jgi:hypothetical protein
MWLSFTVSISDTECKTQRGDLLSPAQHHLAHTNRNKWKGREGRERRESSHVVAAEGQGSALHHHLQNWLCAQCWAGLYIHNSLILP